MSKKTESFIRWLPVFPLLPALLTGCSKMILRNPVPENLVDTAKVPGIPNAIHLPS